jgi:hypothetical protein
MELNPTAVGKPNIADPQGFEKCLAGLRSRLIKVMIILLT